MDRGLIEIRNSERGPRAFFTEAGLQELRRLLLDRRHMDPERFAHLRRELGLPMKSGSPFRRRGADAIGTPACIASAA